MKIISEIPLKSKVLALDFDNDSKFMRFNTDKYQYVVFNVDDPQKPSLSTADAVKKVTWATHTIPFSPETQGIMT